MKVGKKAPRLSIDDVIRMVLLGLYKDDFFNDQLYLKGGQALRLKEKLDERFSADIDFSLSGHIANEDDFYERLKDALYAEFQASGYYVFDFKHVRRPEIKKDGAPDFWGGWGVEFKFIEDAKKTLPHEQQRREALVPVGCQGKKITLDLSEYEYCQGAEKIKIGAVDIVVYSRSLLLCEKIRAICQQHPDYPHKDPGSRSRDYYDIERLWSRVLVDKATESFIAQCKHDLPEVFKAKGVDEVLLEKINDASFVDLQKKSWDLVKATVSGKLDDFSYYVETVRMIVSKIKA